MLRRSLKILTQPSLTRATRLQLGNVKSEYGSMQTAAGSQDKWGFIYRGWKYQLLAHFSGGFIILMVQVVVGVWAQYRDMVILSEHICYEDVKDRCITSMPGYQRLACFQQITPAGCMTYRDPTPLDWLPMELKLGQVKQASY